MGEVAEWMEKETFEREATMSEPVKKPNNVEVLKVEVKGENFAKAQLRCLDTGETSWHGYYRKRYKPKAGEDPRTDAEIMVVPGAKLRVAYLYQDGRAKNDGSGEKWPGDYNIKDVERLADTNVVQAVFNAAPTEKAWAEDDAKTNVAEERVSKSQIAYTDRDRSIMYQSARKDAAVIEAAFIVAMGPERWEKERGWASFKSTTEDCYKMVNDLANNGFDPFGE